MILIVVEANSLFALQMCPFNGKYTVFGQVVEGDEIIDQIINLPRDAEIIQIEELK